MVGRGSHRRIVGEDIFFVTHRLFAVDLTGDLLHQFLRRNRAAPVDHIGKTGIGRRDTLLHEDIDALALTLERLVDAHRHIGVERIPCLADGIDAGIFCCLFGRSLPLDLQLLLFECLLALPFFDQQLE